MEMTLKNPFVVKGSIPDKYFCDRVEESRILVQHITNGHNILLVSPRRIGKTGLIEHCFQFPEIRDEYYTFFIDILQTSSLKELTYTIGKQIFDSLKSRNRKMIDMFLQTVHSVSGDFSSDPLTNMPKFSLSLGAIKNPEYTLEEIFSYINKADKRCVIAIDEFQQITRYPEKNVEALLRTHIQHCANAEFIFAGSERHILSDMFTSYTRPFFSSTTMMSLEEIKPDIYIHFACYWFNEYGKKTEAETVEKIYRLLSGNTYCIQRVMNEMFERTDKKQTCGLDMAKKVIEDILLEQEHSFKMRLSLLAPKPKEVLYAVAKEGVARHVTSGEFVRRHQLSSASSVQSAIKQLLTEDWITFSTDDNGSRQYTLTDPFLCLWIKEHYGIGYQL